MPARITHSAAGVINLAYDGSGKWASKSTASGSTYYFGEHYEIANGAACKFIFAGKDRIAMVKGGATSYFHKDHLGSSTATTNGDTSVSNPAAGNIEEQTDYMPFGGQRGTAAITSTDYQFTDQEWDGESGLYNYDARLYDPAVGRFVTADSVVPDWYTPQSMNRYSYCLNNPLVYIDPTGNEPYEWADSWDWHYSATLDYLDQMVSDYSWSWLIAATTKTCMDVGSGFVDVLRSGEGLGHAVDGDYWGAGRDVLRGFSVASFSGGALSKAGLGLRNSSFLSNEVGAIGYNIDDLIGTSKSLFKPTIKQRYLNAVQEATKRHNGNVTIQREGVDLFRVHQPTSGHGLKVSQIVRRPRPSDGKAFPTPREVPVRRTHLEQLERALKGDPRYSFRTRGGR